MSSRSELPVIPLIRMRVHATTRRNRIAALTLMLAAAANARAAEHITLRNGFELDCLRREAVGDKVRLFLSDNKSGESNYMDVPASAIVRSEFIPDPPAAPPAPKAVALVEANAQPTPAELRQMLTSAGTQHNIDADLLASLVNAESGGHARAVSRAGARGLMQLMPGTAAALGVADSFAPAQNVEGGTRYFDQMLTRYHDNLALALAAYNAGPGAVDRYHGVPPFRETRAYVSRIMREFNRRKLSLLAQTKPAVGTR